MEHVLIVEPDGALAALLADCVRTGGWRVDTASHLEDAAAEAPHASTLVLANLAEQADVERLVRLCRRQDPPVAIAMAQRDRLDLAIGALRGGARDFLAKPFDVRALERALAIAAARRPRGAARRPLAEDGEDPAMQAVLVRAETAARADATVAICGERATGRRRLARFVHGASERASGPLLEVDADALDEAQAVADLFDGERGAFRLAAGGSLVLVEPGALPPHAQQQLLAAMTARAGAFEGPRLLLVTERPLRDDVRLRPDLRLRLDVVSLRVPPLRERPRELARLVRVLADRHAAAQGVAAPRFGSEALAALRAHPFAGNLREVENLAQRAVLCFAGATVDAPALLAARSLPRPPAPEAPVLDLRELERRAVVRALALHAGNRTHAARTLGISVRTLRNKLHQYGLV